MEDWWRAGALWNWLDELVYAGQVLCWMKPFMAPLHAWKGAIAPGTVALLPQKGCSRKGTIEPRAEVPRQGPLRPFEQILNVSPGRLFLEDGSWGLIRTQERPDGFRW